MTRRVTCRCHCSTCGTHFSSVNAFEGHRAGDHAHGRYCIEPLDDGRFIALTENGICSMYAEEKVAITVWTLADDLARARQSSGGSRGGLSGPESVDRLGRAREALTAA